MNDTAVSSRRPWLWLMLMAVTALAAACGGGGGDTGSGGGGQAVAGTPPASEQPAQAADCGLSDFQADWLAQVNARRAAGATCGNQSFAAAGPLAVHTLLQQAADAHSRDMATHGFMDHVSSDGRRMADRVNEAGYDWSRLAENVARGQASVSSVMNSWMGSEGHCTNIMNPQLQHVAVACVRAQTSGQQPYWTMKLGTPR